MCEAIANKGFLTANNYLVIFFFSIILFIFQRFPDSKSKRTVKILFQQVFTIGEEKNYVPHESWCWSILCCCRRS